MAIWAIADLHLSFGVPSKNMDVFGEQWVNYAEKIQHKWSTLVSPQDLVLIPGDISWAMYPEEAMPDLEWIHQLPGTKVMIRGNHDYWWNSLSKVEKILPSSIHLIQNNAFHWNDFSIAGARLWDTREFSFASYIEYKPNKQAISATPKQQNDQENDKIYHRELGRLEMSLKAMQQQARPIRLAMTHYPPISGDLQSSQAAHLLEKYAIQTCVFGHLHNVYRSLPLFGEKNGIRYILTAADYIDFTPIKIYA